MNKVLSEELLELINNRNTKKPMPLKIREEIIKNIKMNTVELVEIFKVSKSYIHKLKKELNCVSSLKKYQYDENIFTPNTNECDLKYYFIGFIAGDGNVYEPPSATKQKLISIQINKKDIIVLEKFKEFTKSNKPISKSGDMVSIQYSSNKMAEDLFYYGIIPRKTRHMKIKNIPHEFIPSFLRGLLDSDGSIKSTGVINYTGNQNTIDFVFNYFDKYHNIIGTRGKDIRNPEYIVNFIEFRKIYNTEIKNIIYYSHDIFYLHRKFDNLS